MIRSVQQRASRPWFLFILPIGLALIGASLYAWGMFGLDNTPPAWASGMHSEMHRYGEATYAYAAGNLAFAAAFLTAALCLIVFLITPGASVDE